MTPYPSRDRQMLTLALLTCPTCTDLRFVSCGLDLEFASMLSRVETSGLQRLWILREEQFDDMCAAGVAKFVAASLTITEVNVSCPNVTTIGVGALQQGIAKRNAKLKREHYAVLYAGNLDEKNNINVAARLYEGPGNARVKDVK